MLCVAEGAEREVLWSRWVVLYRTYATYAKRTSPRISVVVLELPLGESAGTA